MNRTSGTTRRTILGGMMAAAGLAGIGELPACAAPSRGGLADVEHVVILMQENRSFDHYFGTMSGVRGFGDRTAVRLSPDAAGLVSSGSGSGSVRFAGLDAGGAVPGAAGQATVFAQPDTSSGVGYRLPFRVDTGVVDGQDLADLPHDWTTTHRAWSGGAYDGWVPAKSPMTMGYFTEADIPFHRALAESFTLCDNYYCSILGPTTPNRLYHWTGTIDPGGIMGGPATDNPPDYKPVFRWTTYPERLQQAGISWQIYANDVVGDDSTKPFLGDYGDNPLWLFQAYHDALNSSDPKVRQLAQRANVTGSWPAVGTQDGRNIDDVLRQFITACKTNTLPKVSWVVAPYGYCEHPAARPVDGEAYVERMLKALWDNQDLWRSTVVFINFDENDGLFDHVVPPTAPPGTAGEELPLNQSGVGVPMSQGTGPLAPIGLGPRVPMLVISPWSRGGWVNSQVFDHTSVLRFLEQWTGVREPNISDWRRTVCGDLMSCFDFSHADTSIPTLPDTNALRVQADQTQSKLPAPTPPANQSMPHQDPGSAKARPLPYQPVVWAEVAAGSLTMHLTNRGKEAVAFQAYSYSAQTTITQIVVPGGGATDQPIAHSGRYDLAVHGPNGFLFAAAGGPDTAGIAVSAALGGTADRPALSVRVENSTSAPATFVVGGKDRFTVDPGASHVVAVPTSDGWYDLALAGTSDSAWSRRFAGHLENGKPSRTA